MNLKQFGLTLTLLTLTSMSFAASDVVQEGHYLFDADKRLIKIIQGQGDLTIDHVGRYGYEVYGPNGLGVWLNELADQHDIAVLDLEEEKNNKQAKDDFNSYPSPEQITDRLRNLSEKYPEFIKMTSLGTSAGGHDLWSLKLSDNVEEDEVEPEFKYIANMHGDEIVGRELMVLLLEDLAARYEEGNSEIRSLIDNTEIYIVPSMNPDGAKSRRRGNSSWVDLNRNFPDFTTDNVNRPDGRQPETKAIMAFQAQRQFSLSANFHGGTECVNYPWDTTGENFPLLELVKRLSLEYADEVPGMRESTEFERGVTNGYEWYEVNGGMQDWSYHWYNDMQVTIELSHQKWPSYSTIPQYYRWNRNSMIRYMTRVHQGAGFKMSEKNSAGRVEIESLGVFKSRAIGEYTFGNGEFYKVLEPGRYRFSITQNDGSKHSFVTKVETQSKSFNPNYTVIE